LSLNITNALDVLSKIKPRRSKIKKVYNNKGGCSISHEFNRYILE